MGKGNWLLPDSYNEGRNRHMVYINQDVEGYKEENRNYTDYEELADLYNWWYEDLIDSIKSILPKSFYFFKEKETKWVKNDGMIIAENGLYEIILGDNETSIAVVVSVKGEAPNFTDDKSIKFSKKFFDELYHIYKDNVRIRCGPWLSGKYDPNNS